MSRLLRPLLNALQLGLMLLIIVFGIIPAYLLGGVIYLFRGGALMESALKRATLVAAGLGLWFWTQSLVGARPPVAGVGDRIHELTAPANAWLATRPRVADGLLIASSAIIDLLALWLIASAVFGPSFRPFLGLAAIFALRQLCQLTCSLPAPPGMIWRDPGFPSLVVTYGVANDFFFSGHTAIAVFGGLELARHSRRLAPLGAALAAFEIATVLLLRSHYTMDVFTGAVVALMISGSLGAPHLSGQGASA